MAINVSLLRKIRNRILKFPEAYDQKTWGTKSRLAPCNTACCIAGQAVILSGAATAREVAQQEYTDGETLYIEDVAARVLNLNYAKAEVLFTSTPSGNRSVWRGSWPEPFKSAWRKAKTKEARARVAADYINYIIRTGDVD